jgi:hypothetical protein
MSRIIEQVIIDASNNALKRRNTLGKLNTWFGMPKQVLNSEKYVDRGRSIAKMGGDDKPENGTLVK